MSGVKRGCGRTVRGWLVGVLGFVAACEGAQADPERSVEPRARVPAATRAAVPQSSDTPAAQIAGVAAPRHATEPAVHLSTGDSVEIVGVGPAMIPNQPTGLLFTYHPFFVPNDDSARTIRVAKELWRSVVRPGLREPLPPFIVLQATSRRAGPILGVFTEVTYGVVLERRQDGKWLRLGTSQTLE